MEGTPSQVTGEGYTFTGHGWRVHLHRYAQHPVQPQDTHTRASFFGKDSWFEGVKKVFLPEHLGPGGMTRFIVDESTPVEAGRPFGNASIDPSGRHCGHRTEESVRTDGNSDTTTFSNHFFATERSTTPTKIVRSAAIHGARHERR